MKVRRQVLSIMILSCLVGGCGLFSSGNSVRSDPEKELPAITIERLRHELAQENQLVKELQNQLKVLASLPTDRLEHVVCVSKISFGRYSRIWDSDKDGVNDGALVYLLCYDQAGDQVKAGGIAELELFDLAAEEGRRLIGKWNYNFSELAKHYLGGLMNNHFKFELQYPADNVPVSDNLTLVCRFSDALTGKTFEIQKLIAPVRK